MRIENISTFKSSKRKSQRLQDYTPADYGLLIDSAFNMAHEMEVSGDVDRGWDDLDTAHLVDRAAESIGILAESLPNEVRNGIVEDISDEIADIIRARESEFYQEALPVGGDPRRVEYDMSEIE